MQDYNGQPKPNTTEPSFIYDGLSTVQQEPQYVANLGMQQMVLYLPNGLIPSIPFQTYVYPQSTWPDGQYSSYLPWRSAPCLDGYIMNSFGYSEATIFSNGLQYTGYHQRDSQLWSRSNRPETLIGYSPRHQQDAQRQNVPGVSNAVMPHQRIFPPSGFPIAKGMTTQGKLGSKPIPIMLVVLMLDIACRCSVPATSSVQPPSRIQRATIHA